MQAGIDIVNECREVGSYLLSSSRLSRRSLTKQFSVACIQMKTFNYKKFNRKQSQFRSCRGEKC
jgi:hypothetical protein